MKHLIRVFLVVFSCVGLHAETAYRIQSVKYPQIQLHVIEFAPEENHGFALVYVGGAKGRAFVSKQFDASTDCLLVNGGYFDGLFRPVGYCQIAGVVLSGQDSDKLSGYLVISKAGELDFLWKERPDVDAGYDVLQAGPYVIDPGGKIGIHSRAGTAAKRTLIGKKQDGSILVITTTPVFLDQLAQILKEELEGIERVLNLDGDPSTGLRYGEVHIENVNPVRNFLRKAR